MAKRGPKEVTEEHKAAMKKGREESRAVRDYLEGLRATKPKRGRKRTPESIQAQLDEIEIELQSAAPLDELRLIQKRRDLTTELEHLDQAIDMESLEAEFVKVAKSYGERQGIDYQTWRDVGVAPATLKSAGIGRGG